MTDEELIEEIKKGNEDCENEIFLRYKDLVTKICRGYFIVGGEMEDLIQEGMIGLYKAIKSYTTNKETSFKTYAVICIKHQIQSAIKRANTNKNKPLSSAISFQRFTNEDSDIEYLPLELILDSTPAEKAIDKENFLQLKMLIKKNLSSKELTILKYYLQGYSYKEISQQLNISNKAIDNALTRIKTKLKVKLKEQNNIN